MDALPELLDYQLFRAGVLLGHIRLGVLMNDPPPPAIVGMLEPTAAFDDIGPMSQTRMRTLPEEPVYQFDHPHDGSLGTFRGMRAGEGGSVEYPGIAADRVLSLRRATGEAVAVDSITITRTENRERDHAFREACAVRGVELTVWGFGAQLRPSASRAS